MRAVLLPMLLLGLTPALAEEPAPTPTPAQLEDARTVTRLNQVIIDNNRAIRSTNESAEAAYRQERARYEAALAENGRARADAQAAREAFDADSRQHEADMAQWRANPGVRAAERRAVATSPAALPTAAFGTGRPVGVSSGSAQIALDAEASRRTKLVCHTRMDTGSLVKRTRTCGSADSWRRRIAGEQADARDLVKRNGDGLVQQ